MPDSPGRDAALGGGIVGVSARIELVRGWKAKHTLPVPSQFVN